MYIDFAYYYSNGIDPTSELSDYMPSTLFARSEFRARKIVDRVTQGRVKNMETVPEAVKLLMVELVNLEASRGTHYNSQQAVSSFSNDGYSETYVAPLTDEQVKEKEDRLILEYLSGEVDDNGVPLLYLGVD